MAEPQATYDNRGSYASLFNPLSPLTGGVDRIPGFMKGLTGSDRGDWLVAKAGAVGLLALAMAGATRGIKQLLHTNAEGVDKDNPAYKIQEQVSSTIEPTLGMPKTAADYMRPDWNSLANIGNLAIPLLAAGLGIYGGWKGMDKEIDEAKNNDTDVEIAKKHKQLWKLVKARARLASGRASDAEIAEALDDTGKGYTQKLASLNKTAEGPWEAAGRGAVTLSGLALLAAAGFSALGAYRYFSSVDENNARYKDVQKGLREYAKQRALSTPITVNPTDEEAFLAALDEESEDKGKSKGKRAELLNAPEVSGVTAPISVTL